MSEHEHYKCAHFCEHWATHTFFPFAQQVDTFPDGPVHLNKSKKGIILFLYLLGFWQIVFK